MSSSIINASNPTPFDEALGTILTAEKQAGHPQFIADEMAAIASHWLKAGGGKPLILPAHFGVKWATLLSGGEAGSSRESRVHVDYSSLPEIGGEKSFTFIDLFAGIGGFHQALSGAGGRCIFSSEWEPHAKETYFQNYGITPFGDITHFTEDADGKTLFENAIPEHDVLAAGFPCQAFSQAGKGLGFADARGTLFFEILKIARKRRPKILILENVKRLKTHDGGKTFKVIINSLHEIGYKVYAKVLRARDFDLPQNRERIFIVAFDQPVHFQFPEPPEQRTINCLGDILESNVDDSFTITDRLYQGHLRRRERNAKNGKGFGFSVFSPQAKYTNTISARYWKDGSEILVEQPNKNPRMLTPRECARLQGFPESFQTHRSKRYAYQQFGNSVPVKVVRAVIEAALQASRTGVPAESLLDPLEPVVL
jgi:DNA (cytosine-5)-methyltransferase 1